MVCLGNICRSPLAEGIMRKKIEEKGLGWQVDSAGTGGWHIGEAPHKLSQLVARRHGIDISELRGRKISPEDIRTFDRIYVMDSENFQDVKYLCGDSWDADKVDLIMNALGNNRNENVPDPWFDNTDEAFENVFQMLDKACDRIIAQYAGK